MINIKMTLAEATEVFYEGRYSESHEHCAIVTYGGDHYVEAPQVNSNQVEITDLETLVAYEYSNSVKITIIPESGV